MLNISDLDRKGGHVWSKTVALEEDGIFGPLTQNKVIEFQRTHGLNPDGIVGPLTNAVLFGTQADDVDRAQDIATTWTLIARGAVSDLQGYVAALRTGSTQPAIRPALVEALGVHFHLRLPPPAGTPTPPGPPPALSDLNDVTTRLRFIASVFDDTLFVLNEASIRKGLVFHSLGLRACEFYKVKTISGGNRMIEGDRGRVHLVIFPPSFAATTQPDFFRTPHQQASTVLHEVCHYVRPTYENATDAVNDPAYGLPAFDGQPANGSGHNYTQLTPDEAMHCAECYNLFAEHVTFGKDTRFGRMRDDLMSFACGTSECDVSHL